MTSNLVQEAMVSMMVLMATVGMAIVVMAKAVAGKKAGDWGCQGEDAQEGEER